MNEVSLYCFLEEHGDDQVKRGLLLFWGCHPNAEFAGHIICYALDRGKLEVNRALRDLVKTGLVDTHSVNGVNFYSLTTNNEKRRPVLELVALSWNQWNIMTKRIEQELRVPSLSRSTIKDG